MKTTLSTALAVLLAVAQAAPNPTTITSQTAIANPRTQKRQLLSSVSGLLTPITDSGSLESQWATAEAGLEADAAEFEEAGQTFEDFIEALAPSGSPASLPSALASVASVYEAKPTDFFKNALELVLSGLTPSPEDLVSAIQEFGAGDNSPDNVNTVEPSQPVYPKANAADAPFDLDEKTLRAAIHIPSTFTYGKKEPVILVPGTGNFGAQTFAGNFIKLLTNVDYADPVWLNIPGAQLADLQTNTEFVAYAINYISGVSQQRNVSIVSWSAGSLNMRWAGKYWPSTRANVNNHIAISGDYHGTVLADALCPGFPKTACDPAVLQQTYDSTFIATLRANGGDSPYVPTTDIVSSFDAVVQPQENANASGFSTSDVHHVGATNVEVQNTCFAQAAGSLYSHEGVLYNPLAFALAKDALINGGPGQLSRIDVASECQKIVADGLDLDDLLLTEASIPIAGFAILAYEPKVTAEPAIRSYALKDAPQAVR